MIVDDHPLLREGVAAVVGAQPDMLVVGEAENGAEAIEGFRRWRPDVTLMDLQMPDMGGVAAITAIRSEFPDARIVISQAEYDFWTSPMARRSQFVTHAEADEIAYLQRADAEGRLTLIKGQHTLDDGTELIEVGGHTPGQVVVSVPTATGTVVLASDAVHFYEEVERDRPFAIIADLPAMYRAYDLLADLAARPGTSLVAGHDPLVRTRFAPHPAGPDVTDLTAARESP